MGVIFVLAYQHSDANILQPVANELLKRGHNIFHGHDVLQPFLRSSGKKALLLCSDLAEFEHAEGQAAVKQCRWKKIPSISIQHGFPMRYGKGTADIFCLWGKHYVDMLGYNKYVVTGNPAFDVIPEYDLIGADHRVSAVYGEKPKAIMAPMIRDMQELDFIYSLSMEQRADEFIELAIKINFDGLWIVRPHPSDYKYPDRMREHERIADTIGGILQRPDDGLSLYDMLSASCIVAGMSTIVLEGWLLGCEPHPIWTTNWTPEMSKEDAVYKLDGHSADRVADVVEHSMNGVFDV